ncbi:hypothetical protein U1Q18_017599 [Sarracenia purpurea var. burkii]
MELEMRWPGMVRPIDIACFVIKLPVGEAALDNIEIALDAVEVVSSMAEIEQAPGFVELPKSPSAGIVQ